MKLISTLVAAMLLGSIAPSYSQVAFSEDFEGVTVPALPADWVAKSTNSKGNGWKTNSGAIVFTGSGTDWAIPAHSKYVLMNDWAGTASDTNNEALLITPLIDMSALVRPYFYMDYYFVNARTNTGVTEALEIKASLDTGKTWTTVKAITTGNPYQWQRLDLNISNYIGEDGIMFAVSYADKNVRLIGAAVDNIKVYDPAKNDAELVITTPVIGTLTNYATANTKKTLGCVVFNNGVDTIKSLTVHYQEGANPMVSDIISGLNIAPFTYDTFNTTTQYSMPTTVKTYNINMWLQLGGDVNAVNDSGNTEITTVEFLPKKRILAEEGTGTWCGWCPRGHVFMDSLAASIEAVNFSLVAVHNADPMAVAAYDAKLGSLIGGYPSMSIDRREEVDPSDLFAINALERDYFGFADITVSEVAASGFNYSLKVSVKPALELGGDYRLAVALTEDDVRGGPDGSAWDQTNYYSSAYGPSTPLIGSGLNWYNEPAKVPASKMHYNHVARAIYPNPDGALGSLPNIMITNTIYDYTFNIPMQPWWHRENMHAIVMLIRASDGHVLNSNNLKVSVGVSDVTAGVNELTIVPNPATNNAYINFSLTTASNVDVVITDMMGRTVQTISKENFGAGAHKLNVDLSAVTSGVYNVTVKTDNGNVSTRLSVVK